MTLIKRLALVIDDGTISKVFYPVFPPDRNAGDVLAWLEQNRRYVSASVVLADDGGARHLKRGLRMPDIALPTTAGREVNFASLPRHARSSTAIPGPARPACPIRRAGTTFPAPTARRRRPKAFAISIAGFQQVDAAVFGLSTQPSAYQRELVRAPRSAVRDRERRGVRARSARCRCRLSRPAA